MTSRVYLCRNQPFDLSVNIEGTRGKEKHHFNTHLGGGPSSWKSPSTDKLLAVIQFGLSVCTKFIWRTPNLFSTLTFAIHYSTLKILYRQTRLATNQGRSSVSNRSSALKRHIFGGWFAGKQKRSLTLSSKPWLMQRSIVFGFSSRVILTSPTQ